jgi:mono/diheme cytochrome c family protein
MPNRSAPSIPSPARRGVSVRFLAAGLSFGLLGAAPAVASPTPEQIAFFETKIRPVLAQHCYQCHSAEALRAGKLKASLLVDSRAGMAKGGESGATVVPNTGRT